MQLRKSNHTGESMKRLKNRWLLSMMMLGASSLVHATNGDADIRALIAQYQQALNQQDTNRIMSLYDDDAVFMAQHAPANVGKNVIRKAYGHVFNTIKLDVTFTVHDIDVQGDTAWARTSSAGKTTIVATNATVVEGNNELFIFKRNQGLWKIHQYLFATNQPRN